MKPIKFSIVVIGYNVENFIEQAIASCAFPNRDDYEVIYVDNGSTDTTALLAQDTATDLDMPYRGLQLDKNYGPGHARNEGVNAAAGEFIIFLDGDDFLSPHALDRLNELTLQNPAQVYLYNYARFHENGSRINNMNTKLLTEGYRREPAEIEKILRNFGVAWNKMYRKDFLFQNAIVFGEGLYEDIEWNFKVLILASPLYVTPDVLVYYRHRARSVLRSKDMHHFDALSQGHKMYDFYAKDPKLTKLYGAKTYSYVRDVVVRILAENRLPPAARGRFVREASALLRSFRKLIGKKKKTWTERLIDTQSYAAYAGGMKALRFYDKAEKAIIEATTPYYKKYKQPYIEFLYRNRMVKQPIQNNLVFMDAFWGQKIDCNPLAIAMELEKHGFEIIWDLKKDGKRPPIYPGKVVRRHSREFFEAMACAKYMVSNVNFPDEWIKRPEQVHLQTFHGTPLKLMGLDLRETNPQEMNWNGYARRSKRWDFGISSNRYSTRIWRRNAPYNWKALETGYPRNDIFFNHTDEDVARIRRAVGIPDGKKVALYAPTYRAPDKGKVKNVADTQAFDAERVQSALGDEYVLITRGHYFLKSGAAENSDKVIDVSSYVNSNEICLVADLLISDYSSIMFDYACLRRPIILYAYDYDDYATERGMYFDIKSEPPGLMAFSFDELIDGIQSRSYSSLENTAKLEKFADRFCSLENGTSTKKVVDAVFDLRDAKSL